MGYLRRATFGDGGELVVVPIARSRCRAVYVCCRGELITCGFVLRIMLQYGSPPRVAATRGVPRQYYTGQGATLLPTFRIEDVADGQALGDISSAQHW